MKLCFNKGSTSTVFVKRSGRHIRRRKVKLTKLKGTTEQKYRNEGYFAKLAGCFA